MRNIIIDTRLTNTVNTSATVYANNKKTNKQPQYRMFIHRLATIVTIVV